MSLKLQPIPRSGRHQDLDWATIATQTRTFGPVRVPRETCLIIYYLGGGLSTVTIQSQSYVKAGENFPNDMRDPNIDHIAVDDLVFNVGASVSVDDPLVYGLNDHYVTATGFLNITATNQVRCALVEVGRKATQMQAVEFWESVFMTANSRLARLDGSPKEAS